MSNKQWARVAGLLYLIVIAAGLFAEVFVREKMMVSNDALATMHNIQASEMRWRLGFVADLVNLICGLPVIVIFYGWFKPVSRPLTMLAIFFVLISNAVIAVNLLHQLSPLFFFGSEHDLSAFQLTQLAVLSVHDLDLQEQGYAISLVFFGVYCIIMGCLMYRSSLFPRLLGVLYALAGICYIINSFTGFLLTGFRNPLFPLILVPSFIGELSVSLWLLIMGVKEPKPMAGD